MRQQLTSKPPHALGRGLACLMLTMALLSTTPTSIAGVAAPTTTATSKAKVTTGSYCGVYALYAASCRLGHQIEFSGLLSDRYIGSREGSSLGELLRAGREHGLHAVPLENMTSASLRQVEVPTILHVKRDSVSNQFNHWVLYIGEHASEPVIYDASGIITISTWDDLLAAWDGTALLVSVSSPISTWRIRKRELIGAAALLALLAVVIAALRWLMLDGRTPQRQAVHWGRVSISQLVFLLLLGTCVGLCFQYFSADGLARHGKTVKAIQHAKATTFMQKLSAREMDSILRRQGPEQVVIDARMKADYEANHLPGAINVPVDMSDPDLSGVLASVRDGDHLILYCQSKGCPFAERVARRLLARGHTNLSMFPGGWVEWESTHPTRK